MWFTRTLVLIFVIIPLTFGDEGKNYTCSVKDGDHIYDLSELSERDYWKYVKTLHTPDDATHIYYLSVCHPLRNVPEFCSKQGSGICTSKAKGSTEEPVLVDGGQVSQQGPVVDEEGQLRLKYEDGVICDGTQNYTTWVYFMCPVSSRSETDGPVLMTDNSCHLTFVWITRAACPRKVESISVETCTIKFSNSDHTLNLHSLHTATYYNASSSGNQFEINICGPVEQGHCNADNVTVCDVTDTQSPKVLGTTKEMNLEWTKSNLMLTYRNDEAVVELQFQCDRTVSKSPYIYFIAKVNATYKFLVVTSHICSPENPECTIHDSKGQLYSLWQLSRKKHNWEAIDLREDKKDRLYHINVCAPVNEDPFYECPEGRIGACQTGVTNATAVNLGYLTSQPVVNKDGTISIVYTSGDPCKNGQHSISTHIMLICSKDEHGPTMVEETDMCEYIFTWYTPAACPYNVIQGQDCKVTDPLHGYQFDLSPLRQKEKDYEMSSGTSKYLVNICGPLLSGCGESKDAGVCKIDGKEYISYGVSDSVVTYNDGTLTMEMENGSRCDEMRNKSAKIIFICNHDAEGGEKEQLTYMPSDDCTTIMVWHTKHACPPHRVISCSVISEDHQLYDLSSLSMSDRNEEYFSNDHSEKFVLNVCRSVVHSKNSRCSYNAGACIVDLKYKNKTTNIGDVEEGPYLEDGKLKLKYQNGDQCEDGHYETLIEFKCDRYQKFPFPEVVTREKCRIVFEWATAAACPIEITTTPKPSNATCSVTNPYTGYIYDLNPLTSSKGYKVHDHDSLHIFLNICDDIHEGICKNPHDGACSFHGSDTSKLISAGKANADLKFHPGMVYLEYSGGDRCPNGKARSTVINFICGAENSSQGPVFIKDDLEKCNYQISWFTDLVCERRIRCYVDTRDGYLNLSPLIQDKSNYEVVNPNNTKEKFYLNVCRPLNPIVGVPCHPGSSACQTNEDTDMVHSLGYPLVTPIYAGDGNVQMMYSHGSPCLTNRNISTTSRIIFKCDKKAGKGKPVFKELLNDCQYVFEWNTTLVCKQIMPDVKCQIAHHSSLTNIDLGPLKRPQGYQVLFGNKTFNVNVCGPVCDGKSGVCTKKNESFGLSKMSKLMWDYDKKLKLTYFGGDQCNGSLTGNKSTSIYFECDMQAGFGHPEAYHSMADLECTALFVWKTNITCIEDRHNNAFSSPEPEPEPEPSEKVNFSAINIVSGVFVTAGIVFVVALLLLKTERGQNILSGAHRRLKMSGYATVSQRPAENSSLLNSSCRVFHVDDNDDDLLRV